MHKVIKSVIGKEHENITDLADVEAHNSLMS